MFKLFKSAWRTMSTCATVAGALMLLSTSASAVVDVNKSFSPINIFPAQITTLTILLVNSAITPANNTAFVDTLPSTNLVIANPALVSNSCGGTATATAGGASLSLTGGTIPAGNGTVSGTCTVSVKVTTNTSHTNMAGPYVNTIPAGGVTTSEGNNPQAANATLTITPLSALTGAKAFLPANIHGGGTSNLTITLTNSNPVPITVTTVNDVFPAGLVIASFATAATTCAGGTVLDSGGAALNDGDVGIRLTNGVIPANASCTITASVTPVNSTAFQSATVTNTITAASITTVQGITNTADIKDNINMQRGAQIVKGFAPATILAGGTSTVTFTLNNFNATAINAATFTDALPTGVVIASPLTASTNCAGATLTNNGGGALAPGDLGLQITNATIPAAPTGAGAGSCTISALVTAAASGSFVNNVPAGLLNGVNYPAATATLTVNPAGNIGLAKAFSPNSIVQTQSSTLTITLSNTGIAPASITSLIDNLTTMGAGVTIAPSPAATNNCGGALTATPGATLITLIGGTIPAIGSCQIVLPVLAAANAANGGRTNTIAAGGLVTNQGNNVLPASASLTINRAASVAKAFIPTLITANGKSRLTITLSHITGAVAFTNMGISDPLPAGHTVHATPNLTSNCGGTVTALSGSDTITLVGGSLPLGTSSCLIAVDIQAPNSVGANTNTIPANSFSTAEGVSFNAAAPALLTRQAASVTLNKAFTPNSINGGGPSTLTILFGNTNPGAFNLTNLALTDNFPSGMQIYSTPNATFTGTGCSRATLTATPGAAQVSLSGASIPINSTCTLSVQVTSIVDGNLTNDIPIGTLTSTEGVTNNNNPLASLTVGRNLSVLKSFSPSFITAGTTSTLTLQIGNSNVIARNGSTPALLDTLPAGLTIAGPASTTCTGGATSITANSVTLNGGLFAASSTCTVTVPVTAAATGVYTNTIVASALSTVEGSSNPDLSSAVLRVIARPTIVKAFGTPSIGVGGTSTITFTLSNPTVVATFPAPGFTGVTFSDTLTNMSINAPGVAGGSCTGAGSNVLSAGQTALNFTGLSIAPGSSCTVTVTVTSITPGTHPNQASGVSAAQLPDAGLPSGTVNLTVLQPPVMTKVFAPATIIAGANSTLTFTLSNPNSSALAMPTAAFIDVFPTSPGQMSLAAPLTASTTCIGASVVDSGNAALNVGDIGIRLNSGSIPVNGSCTVSVLVSANVAGPYLNSSSVLTTTNGGTSVTGANATLTVNPAPTYNISGTVFQDVPPNGVLDGGDGATGQVLFVKLAPRSSATCTSPAAAGVAIDPGGTYAFSSVPPGDYCLIVDDNNALGDVTATPPAGWVLTGPVTGIRPITLAGNLTGQDFGLYNGGKLTGTVFRDTGAGGGLANDGIQNGTEAGIAGVTVQATNPACPASLCASTVTDGAGNYTLWIPASANGSSVNIVQSNLSGDSSTGGQVGTTGGTYTLGTDTTAFVFSAGTSYSGVNFGDVAANINNISGTVFQDVPPNGVLDGGDGATGQALFVKLAPRSGATCTSPAAAGVAIAAGGTYAFSNVTPGDYCLLVDDNNALGDVSPTPPAGWVLTGPVTGIRPITLASNLTGQDFGLYNGGKLTGTVFRDTGTGGGLANDGIQNGAEAGIAGVTVKVSNVAGTTTFDTAVTDGDGRYTLWIPAAAGAASLKVLETNLSGDISTGASVGNTGGSYDRSSDSITFGNVSSGIFTGVNFGDVSVNRFAANGQQSGLPGNVVFYPHQFNAGSGGTVVYSVSSAGGWPVVIYRDSNCNGQIDLGESVLSSPLSVLASEQVCIISKVTIPVGSALGTQDAATLQASFTYTNAAPALAATLSLIDSTTVGAGSAGLVLNKTADKATASPGDTITYTVNYQNNGSTQISTIFISDATPAFTNFVSAGCGALPAAITACVLITQPAVGGVGSIQWQLGGGLNSASSGQVTFSVKVNN